MVEVRSTQTVQSLRGNFKDFLVVWSFVYKQWEVMGITLSYLYNGTLILELNLFWKTIQGAIYLKTESPLLPKRCGTDHTGINMKGLLIELRPKLLLDN